MPKRHIWWLLVLALAAAASVGGGNASSSPLVEAQPLVRQATPAPAPKLVCKTGSVVFKDGRVRATGGCTFKGRPVGKWSWANPSTTDAAGTPCTMAVASGLGSSFEPKPKARVTPVFTLRVTKTRFYRAKVLRVGGRTLIAGWDSCGTPLEITSLPESDSSQLCRYITDHSWDLATRTLRLGKIGCPFAYGECRWQLYEKYKYSPTPDITVYGGRGHCTNGYSAVPYAWLNSGCIRFNATAAVVLPAKWGGHAYWDVTLVTTDTNDQPLQVNEIPVGEYGHEDPALNGFTTWRRIGPFTLEGTKPFC